ncbi:MAG: hypothetical protein CL424_08895 [Acidimicrobiaceae bacterium]|nr:hypothetical protein [Acidimicrobiaceae bacterium]
MTEPKAWSVVARNLPEHAGNRIHTDDGAREAGFPAALVAGVTTYAYLTHPLVAAWGIDWVARGGASVRFRAPVFAGRTIEFVPRPNADDTTTVTAVDADEEQNPRASIEAWRDSGAASDLRAGEPLEPRRFELDDEFGPGYGARAGDDLTLYEASGLVHPAVWPAIANRVFSTDLVRGSWIHTRSTIRHHGVARRGDVVDVTASVIDRFERSGERAVVDLRISLRGRPIASVEHEAIIALPD